MVTMALHQALKIFVRMKITRQSLMFYMPKPMPLPRLPNQTIVVKGATLYVTTSPCLECAKLIIQAGILRVVFTERYRLDEGVKLLERAGIEIVHADIEKDK
jgi:pyrimidine deaminase RibD-like protein